MLNRIRVRPHKDGVIVQGWAPAAKGNEQLVGWFVCKLVDLSAALAQPENQAKVGLDKQPKRRTPVS